MAPICLISMDATSLPLPGKVRNSVDLISLNKYVVRLIIVQGGCVVYNSLARLIKVSLFSLKVLFHT